jgi:hypothetical protein
VVVDGMCSAVGIHHLPFARCAGLTAGDVMVTAAIGANAIGRRAPGRSVPTPMGAARQPMSGPGRA